MTTAAQPGRLTPAALLFPAGDRIRPAAEVTAQLCDSSALRLVPDGRRAVTERLDAHLAPLLDSDLSAGPVEAVASRPELLATAADAPEHAREDGTEDPVPLGSFKAVWTRSSELEICIDSRPLATVTFTLTAGFDLTLAAARVTDRHLTGLDAGECELSLTLTADTTLCGQDQLTVKSLEWPAKKTIEPLFRVPLGRGIPLPQRRSRSTAEQPSPQV